MPTPKDESSQMPDQAEEFYGLMDKALPEGYPCERNDIKQLLCVTTNSLDTVYRHNHDWVCSKCLLALPVRFRERFYPHGVHALCTRRGADGIAACVICSKNITSIRAADTCLECTAEYRELAEREKETLYNDEPIDITIRWLEYIEESADPNWEISHD
ncbi:uncharacterized protein LOC128896543 [Hylaeus anthracinus]|uniref:uncharacterized protein LOC128896543 n=1 Tax=Hylaeus anthracinus TaxID=313031 RepID=UPI0023B8E728|nr:uncharacterized protein LOC128896543 [Hylaeus anthracinus]